MNLWLILLLTLPVLGLLLFGKNPIREYQKQQAEIMERYGKDELTIKANIYAEHKKNSMFGGGVPPSDMTEKDMKAAIQSSSSPIDPEYRLRPLISPETDKSPSLFGATTTARVAQPDRDFPDAISGSVEIIQRPDSDPLALQSNSVPPSGTAPVQKDSYYPPLVTEYKEKVAQKPKVILTGKEAKLRSGQVIIFEGISVYYVDASGGKTVMPDGRYTLEDGRNITVSGGVNVASRD